jgi:hypothetical protein
MLGSCVFRTVKPLDPPHMAPRVLLQFFPPICPFAPPNLYFLKWYSGMFCTLNLTVHITCQNIILQTPLYSPNVFKMCITWTPNMPRNDQVKKKGQMGRLEEKKSVLIAFISFGWFNLFLLRNFPYNKISNMSLILQRPRPLLRAISPYFDLQLRPRVCYFGNGPSPQALHYTQPGDVMPSTHMSNSQ